MKDPAAVGVPAGTAVPWPDARASAHRLPAPLGTVELPLTAAAGRTLAAPVRAACPLPGFDNAAMDGYAVRGLGPWHVVGRVLAGEPTPPSLGDGQAVEIATGAPVPPGTDRVVEYEVSARDGDLVSASPGPRRHIRLLGEYARPDQELLPVGRVLTAAATGLAASAGVDTVTVRVRPTVRVLITGDEVVTGGVPPPGMVRDAIGPLLVPLLAAWGGGVVEVSRVPDHPAEVLAGAIVPPEVAATTRRAGTPSTTDIPQRYTDTAPVYRSDVTIVCGSSSVGPADRLAAALDELGAVVHVNGVHCRPGHPQVLAQLGPQWLVGVPGNPFAALVAAFTLVEPLLAGLSGRAFRRGPLAPLHGYPAASDDPAEPTRLVPVRWQGGEAHVVPGARPGYLGAAALADGLAVIPPAWRPDEPVELLPMPA